MGEAYYDGIRAGQVKDEFSIESIKPAEGKYVEYYPT